MATNEGQVIEVKPDPDVYTVLMGIVALVMIVAMSLCMYNLMSSVDKGGYGLPFKSIFNGEMETELPK